MNPSHQIDNLIINNLGFS